MARTVVGLDIGSSGVRAAEFALGRRAPTLRKLAVVDLPEGVIHAGMVADEEALAEALRELWSKGRFSTKAVVAGVANDAVLVRQMDLDWMPPADFRKGLRYQVADALPIPVDEANLDYFLLEDVEVPQDGADTEPKRVARVMLVAAGREMVDGFARAIRAAGLRPERVDLVPFALVRLAGGTDPAHSEEPADEAVVDVGADTVVVVVHRGGRPHYVRTIQNHGGQAVTRALMDRFGWSWEDAERSKIALGLPGYADPDAIPGEQPPTDHPAQHVIAEQVEGLVAELRATLAYQRGSGPEERRLSRMLLAGSGARLRGLAETVAEQLGVPVERLDAADRIQGRRRGRLTEEQRDGLTVPAGLCVGVAR